MNNEKIVIDRISENNTYKLDTSKPYVISRGPNFLLHWSAFRVLAILSAIAIIPNIFREDNTAVFGAVIATIVLILLAILSFSLEKRQKKKDKEFLEKSILFLGTVVGIKSNVIGVVKLDNSFETIEYAIEEVIKIDDKRAIIKTGKKPVVLFRCTLIAL